MVAEAMVLDRDSWAFLIIPASLILCAPAQREGEVGEAECCFL